MKGGRVLDTVLAILAIIAIGLGAWHLIEARDGITVERVRIGQTPGTVFRAKVAKPGPVVVIAHGFAGSQQLMQQFATTLARNGVVAVTFDFLGHGRNPRVLTGDITTEQGATRALVAQLGEVATFARGLGDGRLAVLGHSMASDIVVRYAQATPDVAATIAVSMFSPVVTTKSPRNLLVIVGGWEGMLKDEALRVTGLVSAPQAPVVGTIYGDPASGTARRVVVAEGTEHVSVLFSAVALRAALDWVDLVFARPVGSAPFVDDSGGWIALLFAGLVPLARPLFRFLPVVAVEPAGANLPWRRLAPLIAVPAIATPLLLRVLPTHFLPVLVADYLAVHFVAYGAITALGLWWRGGGWAIPSGRALGTIAIGAAAVTLYWVGAMGWTIDRTVTSFVPTAGRLPLIAAMLVGTLAFFLTLEWLTRGGRPARGGYAVAKIGFLVSLAIAVALDLERLFFLIIIVPVIVVFFVIGGLFSAWAYRRTGHPAVGAIASAIFFAWAIGVTFPLIAG